MPDGLTTLNLSADGVRASAEVTPLPFDTSMQHAISQLLSLGMSLHWLHPREKRPIGDDWQTKPTATLAQLRARYRPGNNLGLRLGEPSVVAGCYLHVLDIDIREPRHAPVAWAHLRELFPGVDFSTFPTVMSGSGGESRHIYLLTDKPFASKKLARSEGWKFVFDPKKGRDVKKRDWEIELFGALKQVAIPPSIHPDTGLPYRWLREFDGSMLAFGIGPIIPAATIDAALPLDTRPVADEHDAIARPKLGLTPEDAREILKDLPLDDFCDDRDGWLQVGMALHHEFGEDGRAIWDEWSKQSTKFDPKGQKSVWKSFREKPVSVRMATLKAAANSSRIMSMFGEEEDEFDEPAPAPAAAPVASPMDDELAFLLGEVDPPSGVEPAPAAEQTFDDGLDAAATLASESSSTAVPWAQLLHFNEEGALKPTLHNLHLIIENDIWTRGVAGFNDFRQELVQVGVPGRKKAKRKNAVKEILQLEGPIWRLRDQRNGDNWTDRKDNAVRRILEAPEQQGGYGIKVSDRDLKAAVDLAASARTFHPVQDYLTSLTWDGKPRVERLFVKYLGSPDDAYTRTVPRLMMVAAVTRVFEPGHKFDFAVILEGSQGKRKSTFIKTLARHWFGELSEKFEDDKAMVESMKGAWILEIGELSGFNRADVRQIKSFISSTVDRTRLSYDRRATDFPRQCIFIGSTNDREYLRDDTGGRRFWPIMCLIDVIDTEGLEAEIDQLWAEALAIYREMRAKQPHGTLPLYLADDEVRVEAERLQESRRVETADDALAGQITAWLDTPVRDESGFDEQDAEPVYRNETCLLEIWCEMMAGDKRGFTLQWAHSLGRAMKLVDGWEHTGRKRVRTYGLQRIYERGGIAGRAGRSQVKVG